MTEVKLRVRTLEVVASDGSRARGRSVYCPRREHSTDVEVCRVCEHLKGETAEAITCAPPDVTRTVGLAVSAGSASSDAIVCACADVPVKELLAALPPDPWALPVVDGAGHFLGFLSRERLRTSELPWQVAVAADLMVDSSLTVHETMSLRAALELMVHHRARVVALVDDEGTVRGLLTDIEALRASRGES
jgi:CBS domain-containing protein